jgi:hypothetical protein
MEMNVEKTKERRISKQPSPLQIMIDGKQQENVEYCSYLGSIITHDIRYAGEIKSKIFMAKAAFNKNRNIFKPPTGLKFKEKNEYNATFGAQLCVVLKFEHFGK